MKAKSPKTPKIAEPIPVPQTDSAELVDVQRRTRVDAAEREGARASLLTPGGARGVTGGDTQRKRLGYGAIASGTV